MATSASALMGERAGSAAGYLPSGHALDARAACRVDSGASAEGGRFKRKRAATADSAMPLPIGGGGAGKPPAASNAEGDVPPP